ncbi:hypothetical protein E4K64_33375 [Bradyrhizobium frederickii]|uniref:Helix-turn-helix domain-containing protein n=1 Tax=Bradyrhizobium frederickii TaxID=2560054 RepID=A0A4Y9NT11_9BRAD|nr:hypothetical protein [Bradyrhizobium frederickii]TFV69425.1 hypothetical protein E4K64_33375 [Bradyrhizobium frederickii]
MTALEPRLISGSEAAAYCGVTVATWAKWVAAGIVPPPLPGTRRWDRKAIDLALDKASGIKAPSSSSDPREQDFDSAYDQWKRDHEANKARRAAQEQQYQKWIQEGRKRSR